MTGFIDDSKGNLKKLMRIALVGIKPADQILLKGYLRVLLRLEVDLEWVAANHTKVDLFMINKEFRQASSVMKLLGSQPQKPVLYTSRTDGEEGGLTADQLVLPLKTLQPLNVWLLYSVAVLKHGAGAVTDILQKNQREGEVMNTQNAPATTHQIRQPPRAPVPKVHEEQTPLQSSASISASNSLASSRAPLTATPTPVTFANTNNVSAHDYQGFIIFIQQLQQRPAGLYHIVANKQVIAIVEPSHARIWLPEGADTDNTPPILSLAWQLQPYTGERPENNQATDLLQYLWQYAWLHSDLLLPLVSDEISYQLRYWIKPALSTYYEESCSQTLAKKDRQTLLGIMTALEVAPCSVTQLANRAQISVKSAKKIVASLLFSGSLHPPSYTQLYVQVSRTSMLKSPKQSLEADAKLSATHPEHAHNSHDHAQAAVGANPVSAQESPAAAHANSDASRLSAQQQKRGFLASLRLKLGL